MKTQWILSVALAFSPVMSVWAEDAVAPVAADQEGLEQFDKTIAETKVQGKSADKRQDAANKNKKKKSDDETEENSSKERKDNFGAIVSAEAKTLKDGDLAKKKGMGSWVSKQRRKNAAKGSAGQAKNQSSQSSTSPGAVRSSTAKPDGVGSGNQTTPGTGGASNGSGHGNH